MMDWMDTAHRTLWTFIEAFIGVLAGTYALAIEVPHSSRPSPRE